MRLVAEVENANEPRLSISAISGMMALAILLPLWSQPASTDLGGGTPGGFVWLLNDVGIELVIFPQLAGTGHCTVLLSLWWTRGGGGGDCLVGGWVSG